MYRRIVANKIRATFREINAGNYQAMIDSLADSFQYRFHGSHALGGTRTSKKTMKALPRREMSHLPLKCRPQVRQSCRAHCTVELRIYLLDSGNRPNRNILPRIREKNIL